MSEKSSTEWCWTHSGSGTDCSLQRVGSWDRFVHKRPITCVFVCEVRRRPRGGLGRAGPVWCVGGESSLAGSVPRRDAGWLVVEQTVHWAASWSSSWILVQWVRVLPWRLAPPPPSTAPAEPSWKWTNQFSPFLDRGSFFILRAKDGTLSRNNHL